MEKPKKRISVLVSGGGSNLQTIIDRIADGTIPKAEIVQVISSREGVHALRRAEQAGIPAIVISSKEFPDPNQKARALQSALEKAEPDLIVLAGYMSILHPDITRKFARRIINIHPSLIPKYCGKGFYGERVHKAVLAGGEQITGATVHFVDEGVDTGEIIMQRAIAVDGSDDAGTLAAKVLTIEHQLLPEALAMLLTKEKEEKI